MNNFFLLFDPWNLPSFPLNFACHSTHLSPFLCFSTWRFKIVMWHFIIQHKNLLNQIYKWVKCTFFFSRFSCWRFCQLLSSYVTWGTFAPTSKNSYSSALLGFPCSVLGTLPALPVTLPQSQGYKLRFLLWSTLILPPVTYC